MRRREFLMTGLAAATSAAASSDVPLQDRICVFTDHLDGANGFSYEEVARMFRHLGVAGPDLTVRPGGLVLPERVEEDLPKAVKVFREHGLSVPMISTGLTSAGPEARAILGAAARLGIPYYKIGYYHYDDMNRWQETRREVRQKLAGLVDLSRRLKIRAGFHNHSGPTVGGFLWDAWELLEPLDKDWVGIYFDPTHAVVEGGKNGWNFSLRRVQSRVVMLGIKDFVWEKVNGEWRTRWVPLGQGMMPFDEVFAVLKNISFPGPISLHLEYEHTGKTKSARYENILAATEHDVKFLKEKIRQVYGERA